MSFRFAKAENCLFSFTARIVTKFRRAIDNDDDDNNTLKLWKVWTQESLQKYVEFDRPGERSPE